MSSPNEATCWTCKIEQNDIKKLCQSCPSESNGIPITALQLVIKPTKSINSMISTVKFFCMIDLPLVLGTLILSYYAYDFVRCFNRHAELFYSTRTLPSHTQNIIQAPSNRSHLSANAILFI